MKKYLTYQKQGLAIKDVAETIRVVEKAAASRIHLLKGEVRALALYKREVAVILARILELDQAQAQNHPLLIARKQGARAVLIIGGDKGLVGGLYHQLVSAFLTDKKKFAKVWVLGDKVKQYLKEELVEAVPFFDDHTQVFGYFQKHALQSVEILYPQFVSLAEQAPKWVRFLPFDLTSLDPDQGQTEDFPGWPIFEPSRKQVFDVLLKRYVGVFLTQILLEAGLSEFSARTVTTEQALEKTKKTLSALNLTFLKERQRVITQKQLESFLARSLKI